jgi:molecular chaperone GrpE
MTDKKTKTIKPDTPAHADDAFVINELKTKLNELQSQLDECSAKNAEFFDGWTRERADFVNYKKRIERDQVFQQQNMIINITKKYLPVLDDLDRAIKSKPTHGEGAKWAEGFDLIYRKLASALESEGIKEMVLTNGEPFDPNFQEALTHEDSSAFESGQIIEVIQKGYLIGDRVVRPALVRVAR